MRSRRDGSFLSREFIDARLLVFVRRIILYFIALFDENSKKRAFDSTVFFREQYVWFWFWFFFFFFFPVNGQVVKSAGTKWANADLEAADESSDLQIYKSVVQSMEEWKHRKSSSKRWELRIVVWVLNIGTNMREPLNR